MYISPATHGAEALRTDIPVPATLINAHKMGPGNIRLVDALKVLMNVCPSSREMSAVASLITIRMKFAWSQKTWWAGGCLQATRAEANGSVSVCFSAAAGKQAPPARSQTSYVTGLSKQLLGRRDGCTAHTEIAAQYTGVAMAVLGKYTLHNGAATCDHTDSCFVSYTQGLLPPRELWSRTNTRI